MALLSAGVEDMRIRRHLDGSFMWRAGGYDDILMAVLCGEVRI